ncbi:hypothetical protein JCM10908_006346 [Rhodotorula pacifica]|uniref:uncharacterized protein n=1 Tax=Rhodotorula pacifica TaxID=1495444 RepID=UPI0031729648
MVEACKVIQHYELCEPSDPHESHRRRILTFGGLITVMSAPPRQLTPVEHDLWFVEEHPINDFPIYIYFASRISRESQSYRLERYQEMLRRHETSVPWPTPTWQSFHINEIRHELVLAFVELVGEYSIALEGDSIRFGAAVPAHAVPPALCAAAHLCFVLWGQGRYIYSDDRSFPVAKSLYHHEEVAETLDRADDFARDELEEFNSHSHMELAQWCCHWLARHWQGQPFPLADMLRLYRAAFVDVGRFITQVDTYYHENIAEAM